MLWHFNFRGPDVERLVAGRERIICDRFWNELSANPKAIDEATRRHYAELYAAIPAPCIRSVQPVSLPSIRTLPTTKPVAAKGKLGMPVLALGDGPLVRDPAGRHHASWSRPM